MAAPQPISMPDRASSWQLRRRRLTFGPRPLMMGIINVTPDSFSDGGRYADPEAAVRHGLRLVAEGAEILDVGGESTRPYAAPVPADEELRRVLPVIRQLARQVPGPVSVDTSKAVVAREAVAAGAEIINDVTALTSDPAMIDVARETGAGLCAMHMQGTPQTMQDNPSYQDVVAEVIAYLRRRRDELVQAGIPPDRICLDPGIGFGKTADHNLALLCQAWRLHQLGCPVLVGHSRKRFIRQVLEQPDADPLPGTIGVALSLASQGVQVLRVHDVAAVRQALILFQATAGLQA